MPEQPRRKRQVRRIGDKLYRAAVLIVRTRNADGTPGLLEHLRDDDVADVSAGDTEFVIAYLPVKVLQPR